MKAALYCRVSSRVKCLDCRRSFNANGFDKCPKCGSYNLEKRQDADNQLAQLKAWCNANQHEITHVYTDEASGSRSDREQFLQMFADAEAHQFDMVLFWSLDRFSREGVLPTLKYLERLNQGGVAWKSYTEQYLDSTGIFADAIVAILAALAKQERIRISERTKAGLDNARTKGQRLGRPESLDIDRHLVRTFRRSGATFTEIHDRFGISRAQAQRICKVRGAIVKAEGFE